MLADNVKMVSLSTASHCTLRQRPQQHLNAENDNGSKSASELKAERHGTKTRLLLADYRTLRAAVKLAVTRGKTAQLAASEHQERESELPRVSFKIPTCPHQMLGHLLHQIEPLHSVRVESAKELHERAFTKTSKCRSQRHLSHQTELLHNVRGGSGNELLNTETNKISQYVPFADFESALEVLPDTLQTTLKSVLRMDSLCLSSVGPPSLFVNNVEITLPTSRSKLHGCGIFEGQKGPAMAKLLQDQLMTRIVAMIDGLYAPALRKGAHALPTLTPEIIKKSLTDAFVQHDNRVLYRAVQMAELIKKNKVSRRDAKALVDPLSSATALITLYDDEHRTLYVARTGGGGCAVLGRRVVDPRDKYEAHTISMEEEGADDIQRPTRVFGDSARKWTTAVLQNIHEKYLGPPPINDHKPTPTAEPIVSHFSGIERGDFVVVGSEGLGESLDSEQVVGLVGQWLEERGVREVTCSSDGTQREVILPPMGTKDPKDLRESTFTSDELPVIYPKGYEDTTRRYTSWKTQKRFISLPKDENVASHIVRNALDGADRDLAEALYQIRGERGKELRWVIRAWVLHGPEHGIECLVLFCNESWLNIGLGLQHAIRDILLSSRLTSLHLILIDNLPRNILIGTHLKGIILVQCFVSDEEDTFYYSSRYPAASPLYPQLDSVHVDGDVTSLFEGEQTKGEHKILLPSALFALRKLNWTTELRDADGVSAILSRVSNTLEDLEIKIGQYAGSMQADMFDLTHMKKLNHLRILEERQEMSDYFSPAVNIGDFNYDLLDVLRVPASLRRLELRYVLEFKKGPSIITPLLDSFDAPPAVNQWARLNGVLSSPSFTAVEEVVIALIIGRFTEEALPPETKDLYNRIESQVRTALPYFSDSNSTSTLSIIVATQHEVYLQGI
ncbi:unnamed protein product [Cyclocybe aegerita]|uniref:PPM-type phosphatase domain-containing protein n=1 Tax=Cyclocybe aegerita TaxID=1973307 RepID=A0A8S0VXI4_CYCAE|nr:unnamed protein product [Cyclocybe aegerita]